MKHVYVIAEAGVNHNGNVERALEMVRCAKSSGADAVKFQTFRAETLLTKTTPKASYQMKQTRGSSQWNMIKRLELTDRSHQALFRECTKRKIEFLSTPFDEASADFLYELGVKRFKISSGEITNAPFLLHVARKKLPIILSTGMSTLQEIKKALSVLAFGFLSSAKEDPSERKFKSYYDSREGKGLLKEKVTLLQCTTEYPAPYHAINLRAMMTLQKIFSLSTGLSDHSLGGAVPIAAAALGTTIIEKHFTLDRRLSGPDHFASLEPNELKQMIDGIRAVEYALGDGQKKPSLCETKNISAIRKSIVASSSIKKGDLFSSSNLAIKRPGLGLSPYKYWELLGRPSLKNFCKDDLVTL